MLAVRETSDDLAGGPCAPWKGDAWRPALRATEVVLSTGLSHGFLYRPLPEWVEPVVEVATAP